MEVERPVEVQRPPTPEALRKPGEIPASQSEAQLSMVSDSDYLQPAALDAPPPDGPAVALGQPSGLSDTLIQSDAFADALRAVTVLNAARSDEDKASLQPLAADDLVLTAVEEAQQADEGSVAGSDSLSYTTTDERALEHEHAAGGRLADEPSPRASTLVRGTTRGGAHERDGEAEAQAAIDRAGEAADAKPCPQWLATASALGGLAVELALREVQWSVMLLPYAVAFLAHSDEPLRTAFQIWLLRPAYALLIGRVIAAVTFALVGQQAVLEALPPRLTLVIESFRGWQSIMIAWLCMTAVFYFSTSPAFAATEKAAWLELRSVDFLVSVNGWLAALALTRALLNILTQSLVVNLRDGHFEERLQLALLSMRCLRILFATGRAASNRNKRRRAELRAAADAGGGGGGGRAHGGLGALGKAMDMAAKWGHHKHAGGPSASSPPPSAKPAPELFIDEDSAFSRVGGDISESLELLKTALRGDQFVTSVSEARRRALKTYGQLVAEYTRELEQARATGSAPPVDGDGPPGTLPRARLVRWCVLATRRRGGAFGKKVQARVEATLAGEHIACEDFVLAVEAVYREQRFVSASVQSFDDLNGRIQQFLVWTWAALLLVAGIFLVEWGVAFDAWVVPISGTFLSFAVLLGWLPYEVLAGIVFVLASRPYDIGDRIVINDPGTNGSTREQFTVLEIGLLSTRVVSGGGEQHSIQNFVTRRLSVINLHRSRNPVFTISVQLPARTPGVQVSELIEVVRSYIAQRSSDWLALAGSSISPPDYRQGVLELSLFCQSAHKKYFDGLIDKAKSSLYLFIHVYMQAAGMEYVQPRQEVRATLLDALDEADGDGDDDDDDDDDELPGAEPLADDREASERVGGRVGGGAARVPS